MLYQLSYSPIEFETEARLIHARRPFFGGVSLS